MVLVLWLRIWLLILLLIWLSKLKWYSIHEAALQWINSYLSDLEHYFVSWNQTHSPLLDLNIGVHQGSILGSLLFLIYINDIVNSSNILSFVHFADDTTVYVHHDSIDGAIQILNSELAKVAEWYDSNKLTLLNVNKTQMLLMSRKENLNPQVDVILCNEAIQKVTRGKILRRNIVDLHLNWKHHISMISHKIFKSCGIISCIRNTLDIKSKKSIYYCLKNPYLTYCINVWSYTYRTNLKTLCTAKKWRQCIVLRTLFATAQHPHSRDIFINQKKIPVDKLINQQERILAYKVINGTYLLNDFLNHRDVRHQTKLMNIGDLRIPLYTATHYQLCVRCIYRAINTWNGLSVDLRSSSSLCAFKNNLWQLYLSVT